MKQLISRSLRVMSAPDYNDARWDALRAAYYNPATTGSAAQLKRRLGSAYTLKAISEWIRHQSTQQRFLQRNTPKPFFPMSIGGSEARPFLRMQTDLIDASTLGPANRNGGNAWIYVSIDIFSRYAFAIPLRKKQDNDCRSALTKVAASVERLGYEIGSMTSDNEPSFLGGLYTAEAKEELDIVLHFVPVDDPERHKSLSFCDRFCRTLRALLERYMDREGTPGQWLKGLEACMDNYNHSVGRFTGKTPNQLVAEGAEQREQDRLRFEVKRRHQTNRAAKQTWAREGADIVVGTKVRFQLPTTIFSKRTKPKFSAGIHTVTRVIDHCFYNLSFGPDDSTDEAPGLTSSTRFRAYELLVVSRPPQSKPRVSELSEDEMEGKYDSDNEAGASRRLAREGLD